jgi:hypothetical protein
MSTTVRIFATGTILFGAAVGIAGPAAAEPLQGVYTATITSATDPAATVGGTMTLLLAPCGPDCTKLLSSRDTAWFGDLPAQGDVYSGTISNAHTGDSCQATLNNAAMTLVIDCANPPANVQYSLAPKG